MKTSVEKSDDRNVTEEPIEPAATGLTPIGTTWRVPKGFLNRAMIMEKCAITSAEFQSLAKRGVLRKATDARGRTRRDTRGNTLYHEADLQKRFETADGNLRPRRLPSNPGAKSSVTLAYSMSEAKRVFSLIEQGVPLHQIVLKEEIHPTVVWTIAKDFQDLSGALLITAPWMERFRELPLEWGEEKVTTESLFQHLRKKEKCNFCENKRCGLCKDCAIVAAKKELQRA